MLYSILIYEPETVVDALPAEQDAARIQTHVDLQASLQAQGKLGPVVRLMPTTSAATLRAGEEGLMVLDGPFAETKEQLVGFYLVECENLEEALDAARQLPHETGAVEVRPVRWFRGDG